MATLADVELAIVAEFRTWHAANRPAGAKSSTQDGLRFVGWLQAKRPELLAFEDNEHKLRRIDGLLRKHGCVTN